MENHEKEKEIAQNTDKLLPDISSFHDSSKISFNEEKDESEKGKSKLSKFQHIGNMSFSSIVFNNSTAAIHPLADSILKCTLISKESPNIKQITESEEKNERKKIIFQKLTPTHAIYSESTKYGIIRCEMVTTYFFGQYTFSLFTNPQQVETDSRANLRFLLRGENGRFHWKENLTFISFESNESVDKIKLRNFISSVNEFFLEDDYVEIITVYRIKKIVYLLLSILAFILIVAQVAFGCSQILPKAETNTSTDFWIFLASYVLAFLILCYICFRFIISYIRNKEARNYELLKHHIKNYNRVQVFFEDWNRIIFFPCSILVSCPVTMDYIQFNLDPQREIEVESHNLEEIKK